MAMEKDQLRDTIRAGTVLIKDGTLLPETLRIESEPCVPGWRLVKDLNGYALDRKIDAAGWTFFCLAGEIGTIALGADEQSMVRRAIKRILANPMAKPFNSLEITRVTSKRFLGLPYMSVGAQSRHVQEAMALLPARRMQNRAKQNQRPLKRKYLSSRVGRDSLPKERTGIPAQSPQLLQGVFK
jgi:hypothetical protein